MFAKFGRDGVVSFFFFLVYVVAVLEVLRIDGYLLRVNRGKGGEASKECDAMRQLRNRQGSGIDRKRMARREAESTRGAGGRYYRSFPSPVEQKMTDDNAVSLEQFSSLSCGMIVLCVRWIRRERVSEREREERERERDGYCVMERDRMGWDGMVGYLMGWKLEAGKKAIKGQRHEPRGDSCHTHIEGDLWIGDWAGLDQATLTAGH